MLAIKDKVKINLIKNEIPIPANMVKFNPETDQFKFGTVGIYNTHREPYLYKVEATVAG